MIVISKYLLHYRFKLTGSTVTESCGVVSERQFKKLGSLFHCFFHNNSLLNYLGSKEKEKQMLKTTIRKFVYSTRELEKRASWNIVHHVLKHLFRQYIHANHLCR